MKKQSNFKYENHLSYCPECGSQLNNNHTDCPSCGINLVGYNEKNNRAKNLQDSALEMEILAKQNDKINEQITNENRKILEREQKNQNRQKAFLKFLLCCVPVFTVVSLICWVVIGMQEAQRTSQFYSRTTDEVIDYLHEWEEQKFEIDEIYDAEMIHANTTAGEYGTFIINKGYDSTKDLSYLEYVFEPYDEDYQYTVKHQFDADLLYTVNVLTSKYYISYDDVYYYKESYNKKSCTEDEYFVDEYVYGDLNYVDKLGICDIGEHTIHLYKIDEMDVDKTDYLVAIIKLNDNWIYEFSVHTSTQEKFNEMIARYEDFVNMKVEIRYAE